MSAKSKLGAFLLALTLIGAACGGGDDGDSSGGGSDVGALQQEATDIFLEQADVFEVELDEGCTRGVLSGLTDADAQTIIDEPETFTLEAAGDDLVQETFTECAASESVVDAFVAVFEGEAGFDADCARDGLNSLDNVVELLTADDTPPEIDEIMESCFS